MHAVQGLPASALYRLCSALQKSGLLSKSKFSHSLMEKTTLSPLEISRCVLVPVAWNPQGAVRAIEKLQRLRREDDLNVDLFSVVAADIEARAVEMWKGIPRKSTGKRIVVCLGPPHAWIEHTKDRTIPTEYFIDKDKGKDGEYVHEGAQRLYAVTELVIDAAAEFFSHDNEDWFLARQEPIGPQTENAALPGAALPESDLQTQHEGHNPQGTLDSSLCSPRARAKATGEPRFRELVNDPPPHGSYNRELQFT